MGYLQQKSKTYRNSSPKIHEFIMIIDRTKPIPVAGPENSRLLFFIRQFFDLQLMTITSYLCSLLPSLSGKILDIGAGQSPWKAFLNKSAIYQGVDISSAKQFGMRKQKDIVYYDGSSLPFPDEEFDAALCIEVLEHTVEPQLLLREAFRVLKPGSIFTLTVPWSARVHHIPLDFLRFTRFQLDRIISEAGFVEVDIKERGNDICVVANKMIVIGWRLLLPTKKVHFIWTFPLAILDLCMVAVLLPSAHLSLLLNLGSKDDPLGYFIKCKKPHS